MRKMIKTLVMIGLLCGSAFPFKLGLEFQAGSQLLVGANMRFSDLLEIKPQLGFKINDASSQFDMAVSGNFYLPELGDLQHYAGAGLFLNVYEEQDEQFGIDGHYGLRYDINKIFGIFGQVGLAMNLAPEFEMASFSSGVGCTFYIINR